MRIKFNVRRIYTLSLLGLMYLYSGCSLGQQ